jgi:hypothetical protein
MHQQKEPSLSVTLDDNFFSALASDYLALFTALKSAGCPTMKLDDMAGQIIDGIHS